jgi:hypothetical protein
MCRWLLPSFALKFKQTQIGRRTPLWFNIFLREWNSLIQKNQNAGCFTNQISWVCSCIDFIQSNYFLCPHLTKELDMPHFVSEICIRDEIPFLKLQDVMKQMYIFLTETKVIRQNLNWIKLKQIFQNYIPKKHAYRTS